MSIRIVAQTIRQAGRRHTFKNLLVLPPSIKMTSLQELKYCSNNRNKIYHFVSFMIDVQISNRLFLKTCSW